MKRENKAFYEKNPYIVKRANDGKKYVDPSTVKSDTLNLSDGNSKVGSHVSCFNLPMVLTCDHRCECYTGGKCYANGGCYNFASNQATYSENFAFLKSHTEQEIVEEMTRQISEKGFSLHRDFTIGDLPDEKFLKIRIACARVMPHVRFWFYTKKYSIVNRYVDKFGLESIPENLTIIFSHWMNEDGSYFPMDNPYDFPTSEFIPIGREELLEGITHVCPCSDPEVLATCETCDHPCYELKHGESMALLEHSTSASKERDEMVREAHKELKKRGKKARA